MTGWSLSCEYLGLILNGIIAAFYYDPRQPRTARRVHFTWCLASVSIAIVLNCLTVYLSPLAASLPDFFNMGINSAFYFSCIVMTAIVSAYIVYRIYEYEPEARGLKVSRVVQAALISAYAGLCISNLFNGCLFSFDASYNYVHGPLNKIGYLAIVAEAALVVGCYESNKVRAGRSVSLIIKIVPTVALLLGAYQLLYPSQLMTGIIGAIANFILFVNFQSCRVEVDQLTELPNRQSFAAELEHRLKTKTPMKVLLVSVRKFTQVNRVYGHAGGDAILHQVAQELSHSLSYGHVFRFGGPIFGVILPLSDGNRHEDVVDLVRSSLDKRWNVGRHSAETRICVIELNTDEARPASEEDLVRQLEYTLAIAKEEDVDVLRFDEQILERYLHHIEIKHDVETAIEDKRFEVWYQPIYNRDRNCFDAAEALVRMRDDHGRLVSPDEFVPIAETSDLIESITWIVIEDACRLLGSREVPGLERVSVNLTAKQLLQHNLADKLEATLKRYGLRPEQIKLEITERTITENGDLVSSAMAELSARGIQFMMDDFGTGYSNLAGVLNMPFTFVKLDRSLMEGLATDPRGQTVANYLISFFHEMGQAVVAEGIETAEQAQLVLNYGADRVQGFYYARPMAAADFIAWASKRQ